MKRPPKFARYRVERMGDGWGLRWGCARYRFLTESAARIAFDLALAGVDPGRLFEPER